LHRSLCALKGAANPSLILVDEEKLRCYASGTERAAERAIARSELDDRHVRRVSKPAPPKGVSDRVPLRLETLLVGELSERARVQLMNRQRVRRVRREESTARASKVIRTARGRHVCREGARCVHVL
jgi:hypothetical protein